MKKLPIAKEAYIYILSLLFITIILYLVFKPLSAAGILLICFVLFFFRDPQRSSSYKKGTLISPADGTVMSVTELQEQEFIKGSAIKVSIFLSLMNVHINRSPIAGTVKYTAYREGKFLPAFKSHASDINERNTIGIETSEGYRVLVHQITGFIARRIVCHVHEGSILEAGERFGLIKFGSCTEILVPAGTNITVKPGDRVKGGITIIGDLEGVSGD